MIVVFVGNFIREECACDYGFSRQHYSGSCAYDSSIHWQLYPESSGYIRNICDCGLSLVILFKKDVLVIVVFLSTFIREERASDCCLPW